MVNPSTQDCCYVALELSRAKWLVGALLPGRSKVSTALVPGGATDALLDVLDRFAARASREAGRSVPVKVCHEAGYDGFWLARFLLARGVETHVLDPARFLVSRRGRRAKTDRLDVQAMAFTLKAYLLGDRSVCRAVVVPSPEQEDAKRLSRERTHQLAAEKTRHTNRIRGLLALHGIREVKGLRGGEWAKALGELRTGDGRELGGYLRAEIAREFERLHLVLRHMRALDADREAALTAETAAFPQRHKVGVLIKLAGIGPITATALVAEVFHRRFQAAGTWRPISGWRRCRTRVARVSATRASARLATSRPAACWSSSPGVGCAASPAAAWRPGTGAASPSGASGGGRSGSWPWPASLRSPSGATSRPGSCPREQRSALGEGGRASAAGAGGRGRRAETARRQGALSTEL